MQRGLMTDQMPSLPVFLCHSSDDKVFVKRLALDLQRYSVQVWLDAWEIQVGESIIEKIGTGIRSSGWLGLVLTRSSVASSWVSRELNAGLIRELEEERVFVLPLLADECTIPILLRDKKYADFRRNYAQGLFDLLRVVSPSKQTTKLDIEQEQLRRLLLPAVREGMPVREGDLQAVQESLHGLQDRVGINRTDFTPIRAGDALTALLLNEVANVVLQLGPRLGVLVRLRAFPVKSGDPVTESMFNDLYGTVNQLVWALLRETNGPSI
jgi:hypothetical protein